MSTVTNNLKLFKYKTDSDGDQTFNIDRSLSDNFETIDKMLNMYAYDSTFTYSAGMHVIDNGVVYKSLTDNNIGKALTNTTYWSKELYKGDNSAVLQTLQIIYPVGAIYIGMTETCPISALFGTWTKITSGLTLQQADNINTVGTEIPAGLPNIKGTFPAIEGASKCYNLNNFGDAIYRYKSNNSSTVDNSNGDADDTAALDASRASSIYGSSDTVQPPALAVNIWRRTA